MTITAIYENGVLRPEQPLDLKEGERVAILSMKPVEPNVEELEQIYADMEKAKSYDEWLETTKRLPADEGEFDFIDSVNANREFSGWKRRFSHDDDRQ